MINRTMLADGHSQENIQRQLLDYVSRGSEAYGEVCKGLVFGLLSDSDKESSMKFKWLNAIVNDGWQYVISHLRYFTFTRFALLKPEVKSQLLDLVDKITALSGKGVDGLHVGLLRQIRAGDHSSANAQLTKRILAILEAHRAWLSSQPGLIPFVMYTFIRICAEEGIDLEIQERAAALCADLLKTNYRDCIVIGRDLVRAVEAVSHLVSFKTFWGWFTTPANPLDPQTAPLVQATMVPTPKKYVACRLTPQMETEIVFMMEHVKLGRQTFYEAWFQESHLPRGPGDDPNILIADLIRYVIVVYHPTNAIIASNVVQRWSVIGWLFQLTFNEKAAFDAMLSVYLDWFFFNPLVDSIMNVEPGCLILVKSFSRFPALSQAATTYLAYYRQQYPAIAQEQVARCIDLAMKICIEKGVTSSLDGPLNSPVLDAGSKDALRLLFPTSTDHQKQALPVLPVTQPMTPAGNHQISKPVNADPRLKKKDTKSQLVVADDDSSEELQAEIVSLVEHKINLVHQKLELILSLPLPQPDDLLMSLLFELARLKQTHCQLPKAKPLDLMPSYFKDIRLSKAFVLAKSRWPALFPDMQPPNASFKFPQTTPEFSKFKMNATEIISEFPLEEFRQTLSISGGNNVWLWKTVSFFIQQLPLEHMNDLVEGLREAFAYIREDNDILIAGLQDCLMALNGRHKVIPEIFNDLPSWHDSEAFQDFCAQMILFANKL